MARLLVAALCVALCAALPAVDMETANNEQCPISEMVRARRNTQIDFVSLDEGSLGVDKKSRVTKLNVAEFMNVMKNPPQQDMLIDFDAYWCKRSQEFLPVYDEVADRLALRPDLSVIRVELDGDESLVKDLDLKGFPTIAMWKKGSNIGADMLRFHGKRSRVNVLSWVENVTPARRQPPLESIALANYACHISDPKSHNLSPTELEEMCATVLPESPEPSALLPEPSAVSLLQRTQMVWSDKDQQMVFVGAADNSAPKTMTTFGVGEVTAVNDTNYVGYLGQDKYTAIYFHSPSCEVCACLERVWQAVAYNLVTEERQPNVFMASVNGDISPSLVASFNVTAYPTYVLANKETTKVLGTYAGARRVFDLASWIQDLILADAVPILKHQYTKGVEEHDSYSDLGPTYPYTGDASYPDSAFGRNIHTPSSSPSITPSPTPSPSRPCPLDDDSMLNTLFSRDCSTTIGADCNTEGSMGNVVRSICPVSCGSCPVSQEDNDLAVSAVFTSSCASSGLSSSECTCQAARETLGWCDPADTQNSFSRYLNTLCPITCREWVVAGGQPGVGNVGDGDAGVVSLLQAGKCGVDEMKKVKVEQDEGMGMNHLQAQAQVGSPFYPSEFSPGVEAKAPAFVLFHHPSCVYCQSSYTLWDQVIADVPTGISPGIDVGYLSCSAHWATCDAFGVQGVPTIAYMEGGRPMALSESTTFDGERDVETMKEWVRAMASSDQSKPVMVEA